MHPSGSKLQLRKVPLLQGYVPNPSDPLSMLQDRNLTESVCCAQTAAHNESAPVRDRRRVVHRMLAGAIEL